MLLPYGSNGQHLIHISEVSGGRSKLQCPYCGGGLVAKKGKVLAHHFAHEGKSCLKALSADFFGLSKDLPLQQSIVVYGKWKQKRLQAERSKLGKDIQNLSQQLAFSATKLHELLNDLANRSETDFYFGLLAHLQQSHLPLPNFRVLPAWQHKSLQFLSMAYTARQQLAEIQSKIQLYDRDLRWFNRFQLYFLKIHIQDYQVIYKIGLTARPIEQRMKEIRYDLNSLFQNVTIECLAQVQGCAFLEHFFKQKYANRKYALANYTEYFTFEPYEVDELLHEFKLLLDLGG